MPRARANIYAVVKCGVYIQDVFGPFRTVTLARERAQRFAEYDVDDYHSYDVRILSEAEGLLEDDVLLGSYGKDGRRTYAAAWHEHRMRCPTEEEKRLNTVVEMRDVGGVGTL